MGFVLTVFILMFVTVCGLVVSYGVAKVVMFGWTTASVLFRRIGRSILQYGALKQAAKKLQLRHRSKGLLREGQLTGSQNGFIVEIQGSSASYLNGAEEMVGRTRLGVNGGGRIPLTMTISADRSNSHGRIFTGDTAFDHKLNTRGVRAEVIARLNAQARLRLLLLAPYIEVRKGWVIYETQNALRNADEITRLLEEMTEIAALLAVPTESLPEHLLSNALEEPLTDVQIPNMEVLLTRYPNTPQAQSALAAHRNSKVPALALLVAQHLSPPDLEAIQVIARSSYSVSPKALRFLVREAPKTTAQPIVHEALLAGNEATCAAAASEVMRESWKDSYQVLERALERSRKKRNATIAIATAMYKLERERAEPELFALLNHGDSKVVIAMARLLSASGGPAAIAPLRIAADATNLPDVQRVLLASAELIKLRCGASGGTLSLTAPEGGALSEVTEGAGLLSEPSDPRSD